MSSEIRSRFASLAKVSTLIKFATDLDVQLGFLAWIQLLPFKEKILQWSCQSGFGSLQTALESAAAFGNVFSFTGILPRWCP